jgi:hypothetical protein
MKCDINFQVVVKCETCCGTALIDNANGTLSPCKDCDDTNRNSTQVVLLSLDEFKAVLAGAKIVFQNGMYKVTP